MKHVLVVIVSIFFSLACFGQDSQASVANKAETNKVLVYEWIAGSWATHYSTQKDSSEIIRKMLIGSWVDSNCQSMDHMGSFFLEHRIYKDSVVTISKVRPSNFQIIDPIPNPDVDKYNRDTALHTYIHRYKKYKILYVDETKSNSNFKGYAIFLTNPGLNVSDTNMDDLDEVPINSISDKYLMICCGVWGPTINAPTETYKREH